MKEKKSNFHEIFQQFVLFIYHNCLLLFFIKTISVVKKFFRIQNLLMVPRENSSFLLNMVANVQKKCDVEMSKILMLKSVVGAS